MEQVLREWEEHGVAGLKLRYRGMREEIRA